MTIETEIRSGVHIVHVHGELTGLEHDPLVNAAADLLGTPSARVVLDLADVSYMNSAGLGELVHLTAQANIQSARLVLAQLPPYLAGVIETTRLDRFFEIHATVADALAACEKAPPARPA